MLAAFHQKVDGSHEDIHAQVQRQDAVDGARLDEHVEIGIHHVDRIDDQPDGSLRMQATHGLDRCMKFRCGDFIEESQPDLAVIVVDDGV